MTLARLAAAATTAAVAGYVGGASLAQAPSRLPLVAYKYDFSAKEIALRKGVPVTLVISASDFVHGFAVPDLGVRADVVPGKAVEVSFTPAKAGRFAFLCDNFCGEGHDRMTGFLVVSD